LILSFGGYWSRYQSGNGMFGTNMQLVKKPGVPDLNRPGITSIVDSYLTFRLADMMAHPVITNERDVYPLHRTSLWSFVYGSAHTMHYDHYPKTWETDSEGVFWLMRVIWILALLPTAILIVGCARGAWGVIREVFSGGALSRDLGTNALLASAALGYVAFLLVFSYTNRDFGTMKPIYVFPAVAAFIALFARELERLQKRQIMLPRAARGSAILLCAGYASDSAILVVDLLVQRMQIA
jgi:hypothetical protein